MRDRPGFCGQRRGIETLRTRLFAQAKSAERTHFQGRFRFAVDRSSGVGTVVTGTVLSGAITVGDHVMVSPSGLSARVRSIHAQNRAADRGRAGERCALNLTGDSVAKDLIHRGDVVLDPSLRAPADRIDAHLRLLSWNEAGIGASRRFDPAPIKLPARLFCLPTYRKRLNATR
jgi:selenocysteine-specific elongation factor